MRKIITGLDIGTSKICAAIGEFGSDGRAEIRGVGIADARGINKGFVSNLDKLVDSIAKAIHGAEDKAGIKAHNVIANISGASVIGRINEGLMPLSRRGREITKRDVRKVVEITRNISLTLEKDFLYASPQEYIIDDNDGVENALGLFGSKIKVKLYVITVLATHIQNISKAISYAGYEPLSIIPTAVASASNILTDEDKANGVILVDVGGGITEIAVFYGGILRFLESVNVGGMDLTACLSAHFKIPFGNAEMIKKKYGSISKEDLRKDEKNIFDVDNRHVVVSSDIMNNLLKERFDEIFYVAKDRLKTADYFTASIPSLVVTGGSSLLNGAIESFEKLFGIPVKTWRANGITCNPTILSNPIYSAAVSLAKYGLDREAKPSRRSLRGNTFLLDNFQRFKEFLNEYF